MPITEAMKKASSSVLRPLDQGGGAVSPLWIISTAGRPDGGSDTT